MSIKSGSTKRLIEGNSGIGNALEKYPVMYSKGNRITFGRSTAFMAAMSSRVESPTLWRISTLILTMATVNTHLEVMRQR